MVCESCGTFTVKPVCGACRAVARLQVLLREGGLKASQESVVVGILRGAAGALQDLCEEARAKASGPPPNPGWLPGVVGSAPEAGPSEPKAGEKAKEKAGEVPAGDQEESYYFESEEEEEKEQDNPLKPITVARGSVGRAFGLTGCVKPRASPGPSREKKSSRQEDQHRQRHDEGGKASASREGEDRGTREELPRQRSGAPRPPEPDHPPPNREKPQKEKRRSRSRRRRREGKSKGVKKRERGQAWRESRSSRPPQEKQWRPRQKRP